MPRKRVRSRTETQADRDGRHEAVVLLVNRGAGDDEIRAAARGWGSSEAEVTVLLATARARLQRVAETSVETERGRSLTMLQDLYQRALEAGDLPTALSVRREWNKVIGLVSGARPRKPKPKDALDEEIRQLETKMAVR